jgi:hypothetical protein
VTGPAPLRSYLSRYHTKRRTPDQVRRDGWHDHKIAAIYVDDERLDDWERQTVVNIAERFYGKRTEREP